MFQPGARVVTRWAFAAENADELDVAEGEELVVLEHVGEWLRVKTTETRMGSVPVSYVKLVDVPVRRVAGPPLPKNRPVSSPSSNNNNNNSSSTKKLTTAPPPPLPPLPDAFSPTASTQGFASNPLFQQQQQQPASSPAADYQDADDDAALQQRFAQLRARLQTMDDDADGEDQRGGGVVDAILQQERLRVQQQQQEEASRRRAEELRRSAVEQSRLREQQMQAELDSALAHSTVLKPHSKQANYAQLAEDKRAQALTARNQQRLADSCRDNIAALRYWLQAIKSGNQYKSQQDVVDELQRMERLVDQELSLPPLSEFADPVELIDVLVGMVNQGYPTMDGLKQAALRFRGEAARLEQEKQIERAVLFYKQAAQRLIVLEKLLRASGKNAKSVTEAAAEIVTHCEQLKRVSRQKRA